MIPHINSKAYPPTEPVHPGALGWRNPTHVIARRMLSPDSAGSLVEVVVATKPASTSTMLWSAPPGGGVPRQAPEELALRPGDDFAPLEIRAGPGRTPV